MKILSVIAEVALVLLGLVLLSNFAAFFVALVG